MDEQRCIKIDDKVYPLKWRDVAYMMGDNLYGGWCADPDILPDDVCEYLDCMMYEGQETVGNIPAGYGDFGNVPWFLIM